MHGSWMVQRGGFCVLAGGVAMVQLAGLGAGWMVRGLRKLRVRGLVAGSHNVQVEVNSCQTTGKLKNRKKSTKNEKLENLRENGLHMLGRRVYLGDVLMPFDVRRVRGAASASLRPGVRTTHHDGEEDKEQGL